MKRLILLVVVLLGVAGVGVVALWAQKTRIDPFRAAWDRLTGYQSAHERHEFSDHERVRWDPIAEYNRRLEGFGPDDFAWPLIVEASELYGSPGVPGFDALGPEHAGWENLTEVLARADIQRLVEILVRASHKPVLGMPMLGQIDDTTPFEHPEPSDTSRLGLDRLLIADGYVGAISGDPLRFRDRIESALRLLLLNEEPLLRIAQSRRGFLVEVIVHRVGRVLDQYPQMIDEQAAASIDALLARVVERGVLTINADADLVFYEDMVRRMVDDRGVYDPAKVAALTASDPSSGQGVPPPSDAPRDAFTPPLWSSYKVLAEEYEQAAAAGAVPWTLPAEGWLDAKAWMVRIDSIPGRAGRMLAGYSVIGLKSEAEKARTRHQALLGLRVALAAHRHRLRHGEPLASLEGIDPDLLAFEPIDGFTGGCLVYRWTGEGHLVYAFGADGDDDGGRHAVDPEGNAVPFISDDYLRGKWDGDWVVFPPRE